MPNGMRETTGDALEIGEDPVAPFVSQLVQGRRKKTAVIHVVVFPAPAVTIF
jgi:hypothetical protein